MSAEGYENGKIPTDFLAPAGVGQLILPAAASYARVIAGTSPVHAPTKRDQLYRTVLQQEVLLYRNYDHTYRAGVSHHYYKGQHWYKKPGYANAAKPGTSNHGWGKAVDFQNLGGFDTDRYKKFSRVANVNGWDNEEGRKIGEVWHWVYNESNDQNKGQVVKPEQRKWNDVFVTRYGRNGYYMVAGDRMVPIKDTSYTKLAAAGDPAVALDNDDVMALLDLLKPEGVTVEVGELKFPAFTLSLSATGTATPQEN